MDAVPTDLSQDDAPRQRRSPWAALHHALMPDYNGRATAYWWTIVLLGAAALVLAAADVAAMPVAIQAQIAAGMLLAMLAGAFPVRIGRSKSSFAAGETFILLLLLMHGPAAAALAAASETLVGALRMSRRWTSRIASPAISALTMSIAGALLHALQAELQRRGASNDGLTVVAAMVLALVYFIANTMLVSAVPRLKRNEWPRLADLTGVFGWVGIAFAASGAVAGLLFLTYVNSGLGVIVAIVPVMAMLLATLHYYNRQQEAQAAMFEAAERASEREARQAARHVRELEQSERRFHSAFTHASIGMALVGFDGRVLQVNRALRTLLGLEESDMLGHAFSDFVCADDIDALGAQLASVDERSVDSFAVELRFCHRQGHDVWAALHCSFFSDPSASAPCLILQVQDISARRHAETRLQHIAFHDSLTSLPNRGRFRDFLTQAIARAKLSPRYQFAVMFLDFDRFKLINDSMGHSAGDEFLVQITRRLREHVRPTDVVARLGGDEFAILCADIASKDAAVQLAERLQNALRVPLQIAGNEIATSASIGITFSAHGYDTPEEVLRDADLAMYKAKTSGKARHALFDAELHTQVSERVRLERDLRHAVAKGQISVAYQPMFNLANSRLEGFEALARWQHPERGLVSPGLFIPLAEETGLIVAITDLVLERGCRQLAAWKKKASALADLHLHVNISGNDLAHSALVERVGRTLAASGLQGQDLRLELTENILMERLAGSVEQLERLRVLGVGISVDDFGTGYSSLSCLSRLPIDSLKIDRSFVQNLRTKSKEAEIIRAIVSLSGSLGKAVIAEGIETATQLELLRTIGCELGQGYYLAHPLAPERAEALLEGLELHSARAPATAGSQRLTLLH